MLESGHSVAGYQIVKPLTENQLYATYLVTGSSPASVKLLLIAPESLADKKPRQTFLDRSQVLLGQSFPGICSLLAAAADDETCYCLYPVPAGTSLADELAAGFSVRRSLEIVRTVANGLSLPHAAGFWHGSISPVSIYLDGDSVCLDEFALASLLRLDFHSGIDPCYGSPELVRGEPLGSASDLYSLGIVLYRLLVGAVPFCQTDPFATAMQHVQEQPAPLPERLSLLQPLMDGLLSAASKDRLHADQLVEKIDHYLLMPEIDSLLSGSDEQPVEAETSTVESDKPSPVEKLVDSSDMAARIEERLKDRATVLQESREAIPDAQRASSARISAIGKQREQKTQAIKHTPPKQKSAAGRFLLLIALGIAIGGIFYLLFFGTQPGPQQLGTGLPQPLLAGLETGTQQLEAGRLAAAEKTFQGLIADYALYPQPYNNLAATYARQGDLERSRATLERAMATDSSYVTVYRNLGAVYSEMARDSYGRALQLGKVQQTVALQVFNGNKLLSINSLAGAGQEQTSKQTTVQATGQAITPTVAAQSEVAGAAPEAVSEAAGTEPVVAVVDSDVVAEPTTAATESLPEVVLPPGPDSAEKFLRRWAAAWSAQDIDRYLSFYSADFTPADGKGREPWAKRRKSRLTRPKSIKVTLDDFSLVRQDGKQMQIEVTQNYKSDRYADRTRKLFNLVYNGSDWQILRERSLGRVR